MRGHRPPRRGGIRPLGRGQGGTGGGQGWRADKGGGVAAIDREINLVRDAPAPVEPPVELTLQPFLLLPGYCLTVPEHVPGCDPDGRRRHLRGGEREHRLPARRRPAARASGAAGPVRRPLDGRAERADPDGRQRLPEQDRRYESADPVGVHGPTFRPISAVPSRWPLASSDSKRNRARSPAWLPPTASEWRVEQMFSPRAFRTTAPAITSAPVADRWINCWHALISTFPR